MIWRAPELCWRVGTASLCIYLIISWTSKGLECVSFSKLRKWLVLLVMKGSTRASLCPSLLPLCTVRTCFVSDLQRGLKIQAAKFNIDGSAQVSGGWGSSCSFEVAAAFWGSKIIIIQVWFCSQRPSPPPDVDYPLDGEKILHVVGPIRWEMPWQSICHYKDIFAHKFS